MINLNDNTTNRENIWQKAIAISCLVLVAIAILIAHANTATGFELDIYASTPAVTWIFLCLAILGGTSIVISQLFSRNYKTNRNWLIGLLVLVICNFTFLLIPYIRNYFSWGGDNLGHWGMVKDIVTNGHFYKGDDYPITHIILSQLILVTKAPMQLVTNISTSFLSVFFVASTCFLSTVVLPKREQQIIATVIAAIVLFSGGYSVFLMPNGWSIFLLPLLFYFYFKFQSERLYIIPFILYLTMYPFFHPLSSLIVAITLIIIYLVGLLSKTLFKRGHNISINPKHSLSVVFGIIELGILLLWIHSFAVYQQNVNDLLQNIFSRAGEAIGNMGNSLSKVNVHGLEIVILYIKLYGADTILIILSLVGFLMGLKLIFSKIKRVDQESFPFFIIYIGFIFLFFGVIYLFYWAGLLGLSSIGADRMLYYAMLLTPELSAITIYWFSQKLKFKFLVNVLVVVLLLVLSGLSFRGLYYSPYTLQPNAQITAKDMAGFEWLISKKTLRIGVVNIASEPPRFFDAILGSTAAIQRTDRYDVQFLDHFGYQKYSSVGMQYPVDEYAVIVTSDRVIYSTVWKNVGRFTSSDFIQLDEDTTVNKLYSNGGTDVFYIKSITQ